MAEKWGNHFAEKKNRIIEVLFILKGSNVSIWAEFYASFLSKSCFNVLLCKEPLHFSTEN